MSSFNPAFLDQPRFSAQHGAQLRALGQFRGREDLFRKQAPEVLATLRDADGTVQRVRFVPVSPVATPGAMDQLAAGYARAIDEQRERLVLVPLAILDFLCIHPFADGNGRMARLLTLLLLYHGGYEVGRYISLERIVEESKETYYESLEASSQGWHDHKHDPLPWMSYLWGVLVRAYREFEERVGTIRTGRGAKTDLIEQAVRRRAHPFAI